MKSRNVEHARKPALNEAAHNRRGSRSGVQIYFSGPKAGRGLPPIACERLIGCTRRLSWP